MRVPDHGWEEVEHTADWSVRVWAPTFEALVVEAATAMYSLAGLAPTGGDLEELAADGVDREARLVGFLQELVYQLEAHHAAYSDLEVWVEGEEIHARGRRATATIPVKTIKAVTYHGLELRDLDPGLEATIVFDV